MYGTTSRGGSRGKSAALVSCQKNFGQGHEKVFVGRFCDVGPILRFSGDLFVGAGNARVVSQSPSAT